MAAAVCLALAGVLIGCQFGLFDRLVEPSFAVSKEDQAAFDAAKKVAEQYEATQRRQGVPIST